MENEDAGGSDGPNGSTGTRETASLRADGGVFAERVAAGEYTWEEFKRDYYYDENGDPPTDDDGTVVPFDASEYLGFEPDDLGHRLAKANRARELFEDEYEIWRVTAGRYTWADFKAECYFDEGGAPPTDDDGVVIEFKRANYLGYDPDDTEDRVGHLGRAARDVSGRFEAFLDLETTPVTVGEYYWEHFKYEYYYETLGPSPTRPRDENDEIVRFDAEEHLGFDPDDMADLLAAGAGKASTLDQIIDDRTVNVAEDLDEDAFFSTFEGHTTVTNRYDLEKAVAIPKKLHFREIDRYWVNKPYAFVIIFHSEKENEKKYYLVQPYQTAIESDLVDFLTGKLRSAIKYSDDDIVVEGSEGDRANVIEREAMGLLTRYDLYAETGPSPGLAERGVDLLDRHAGETDVGAGLVARLRELVGETTVETDGELDGILARPEPALLEENADTLSEYQVEKLLYYLKRDFIGYGRIDGIKHDINVEDISCDGYNSPVFVYHTDYEQVISNVHHGETELDNFVVKMAQRSGKGISKRQPQVDATLPDGSRAQLTLGREVSDHGTNYTIRQFKDVPFTPIDLINWHTFSLEEMAFLWLCIENHKSLIFAGGTASGKTTSLNAVSLFIPSNTKIVSIEDTREVELPQRNWIASVTRPSFTDDEKGDIDEFDLLEAALRQRPDYIVMGEIRGEEGRTLFQVMSTGHTTYTTFHADSVGEVLKRFTTDPINVSKTMFTALDLVSIQTQTRVRGNKVRRNKSLTEINHYDSENDEINVQDVFQWHAEDDEYHRMARSNTLDDIMFDRGWDHAELDEEMEKRRVIIAYLIKHNLNEYTQVAATTQAFINDPDTILTLIANDRLEESLADLREMESVLIDIDPEKEEMVPRPDPNDEVLGLATEILEEARGGLLEPYEGQETPGLAAALASQPDYVPPAPQERAAGTDEAARTAESLGDDGSREAADGSSETGRNAEPPADEETKDGPPAERARRTADETPRDDGDARGGDGTDGAEVSDDDAERTDFGRGQSERTGSERGGSERDDAERSEDDAASGDDGSDAGDGSDDEDDSADGDAERSGAFGEFEGVEFADGDEE